MTRRSFRLTITMALASLSLTVAPMASAESTYSAGHADIVVDWHGGASFDLHYRFGPGSVLDGTALPSGLPAADYFYHPSEVLTLVEGPTSSRPAGSAWDFLGIPEGAPYWSLPQSFNPTRPYLGLATDLLTASQWSGPITWSLVAASMPAGGEFALWNLSPFGAPIPRWTTFGGISSDDAFTMGLNAHDHYAWGFTKEGTYRLTLRATGMLSDGTTVSGDAVFSFRVGALATVPEPSSWIMMGAGTGLLGFCSWRRRRPSID